MSLFDRSITPFAILAIAGWMVSAALVVADLFISSADDVGHLGLYVGTGAAVLNVRGFIHREECRIKAAFDLGRESGLRRVE